MKRSPFIIWIFKHISGKQPESPGAPASAASCAPDSDQTLPASPPSKSLAERVDAGVRGLPRPILQGMPAPYSGSDTEHGMPHVERDQECMDFDICAVCGLEFEDVERTYTASFFHADDQLLDRGVLLHERCAKIALAHCPHMRLGFSKVFWTESGEILNNAYGRSLALDAKPLVDERRIMLGSTSAEPNLDQPWRPKNEDW